MNFYDLATEVLAQIGITEPDASDRSENRSMIQRGLNEGYRKIIREKAYLWVTEAVTLDANKQFVIADLGKKLTKIIKISVNEDFSDDASGAGSQALSWFKTEGADSMVVPSAEASSVVYVKYEFMPIKLEQTYNISGANTAAVIPVDEAISASEATALAGQKLYLIDDSLGTFKEYTIVSAASGAAGAATITVDSTPSPATADDDEIYIGDNWTPVFNEDWHLLLTYWAIGKLFPTRGPNYISIASWWKDEFVKEVGYITDSLGEPENTKNAYYPLNCDGGYYTKDPLG